MILYVGTLQTSMVLILKMKLQVSGSLATSMTTWPTLNVCEDISYLAKRNVVTVKSSGI